MRLRAISMGLTVTVILLSMVPGIQGLPKWLQPKHEVNDGMLEPRQYGAYEKPTVTYGRYTYGGYDPAPTLTNNFEFPSALPSSEVSSESSTLVSLSPASSSESTSLPQTSSTLSSSSSTEVEFSTTTAASSSVDLLASSSAVATGSSGALSSTTLSKIGLANLLSSPSTAIIYGSTISGPTSSSVISAATTIGNSSSLQSSSSPVAGTSSTLSLGNTTSSGTFTTSTSSSPIAYVSAIVYNESSQSILSSSSAIGIFTALPSSSTTNSYVPSTSGRVAASVIPTTVQKSTGGITSSETISTPPSLGITTPAPATTNNGYPINCNHDNCLRAFLRSSSLAAEFCATYTTSINTALPIAVPGFVSKCYNSPSALSSACSCAVSGPATKKPSSIVETSSAIYALTSPVSASSSSQEISTSVQNTQISSVAVITSTPLGTESSGILPSQSGSSVLFTNSTSAAEVTVSSVVSGGFSSMVPFLPSPTLPYTRSNTSTHGSTASGFSVSSVIGVWTSLNSSYPSSAIPMSPSTSASWYSPIILSSSIPYLGSNTSTNGSTAPCLSTLSAVGIETSLSSPSFLLSGSGTQLLSSSSSTYSANSTAFQVGASGTSPATTIKITSLVTETLLAEMSTIIGPQVSYSTPASIVVPSSSGSEGSLPTSIGSGVTALPRTSQTGIFETHSSSFDFGTGLSSSIPHKSGSLYGISNTLSVYQPTGTGTVPSSISPEEVTSSVIVIAANTKPFGNSNTTFSSGPTGKAHSSKSYTHKPHKSKTHSLKASAAFIPPTPVSSSVRYLVNNQTSFVGQAGTGSMLSSTTFAPVNSTGSQSGMPTSHYSVPYSTTSSPSATSTKDDILISLTFPIFSVTHISAPTGTGIAPSFLSTVGLPSSSAPLSSLNSALSILPTGTGSPVTSTAQGMTGSGLSKTLPFSTSVPQDTCTEEYEYPSNTRYSLVPTSTAQSSSQLLSSLPFSTSAGRGAFGNQTSSIPSTFATSYGKAPQRGESETPSSSLRLPTSTLVTGITTSENSGFATTLSSASQSVLSQYTSSSAGLTSTYAALPYYYPTAKARRFLALL